MARPRSVLTLVVALVLATRVLGLSLVLPAFPPYARGLTESGALAGFAFGAYALAMAALQIPFGVLSDRWGRRPALLLGLAVSAVGSFAAAWAPSIGWLVAARLLQGAGAVNGVALALLGEEAPEDRRTTAIAIAGAAIGVGFTGGVVAGALLAPFVDVPGLFVLNGLVVLAAAGLVAWAVEAKPPPGRTARVRDVLAASGDARVLGLATANFATNLALHAVLFVFPLAGAALASARTASFYLAGAVVAGGVVMFLGARAADRGRPGGVGRGAAAALGLGAAGVALAAGFPALVAAAVVFFAGQSVLAALLPSAAARAAAPEARGGAQSALQLAQSLGVASGGVLAGALVGVPPALAAALALAGVVAFGALEGVNARARRAVA